MPHDRLTFRDNATSSLVAVQAYVEMMIEKAVSVETSLSELESISERAQQLLDLVETFPPIK